MSELRAALAARDFARAEELARATLAHAPADGAARRLLAALLLEQGRAADALAALDAPGDDADLAFLRGHAQEALGDASAAARSFAAAAAARPGWAQAWAAEALMRHRSGDLANARASYAKALALQPADADTREKLAAVLDDAGDAAAAQALLEEGLARAPDAARLWLGLGLSLLREGRAPAAAAEKFAAARKLAPADPEFAYNHALALANDTSYGLSAAVITNDLQKAMSFALKAHAGMVHINGPTAYDEPHVPMGGVGDSGFGGRESGYYNMHEMTELKWITVQLGERPMPI